MSKEKLAKQFIRKMVWKEWKKAIQQVLQIRCRQERKREYGIFTQQEIERIIYQAESATEVHMPFLNGRNLGNYLLLYYTVLTLVVYRSLRKENVESNYAVDLVGDIMIQAIVKMRGFVPILSPILEKLGKKKVKDPLIHRERNVKAMLKFPYSEPGYRGKTYREKEGVFALDLYSCPPLEFMKQFGEEELKLFRRTWCTMDFPVTEVLSNCACIYEREHTLSDGDEVCDMRFVVVKNNLTHISRPAAQGGR